MGRRHPYFCEHGRCLDAGDFSCFKVEFCEFCDEIKTAEEQRKLEQRIAELEAENQRLRAGIETLNLTEKQWEKFYAAVKEGE